MIYFALLGKLGDVVLFTRLSWHYTKKISIITKPIFVDICEKYGNFLRVVSIADMSRKISEYDIIVDLHNYSEQDLEYKKGIAKSRPKMYATKARALFLEIVPNKVIDARYHKEESIIDYWINLVNTLNLGQHVEVEQNELEHIDFKEKIKSDTKIRILVSLQSSTLNKMFDEESARYFLFKLLDLSRRQGLRLFVLRGPGDLPERHLMDKYLYGFPKDNIVYIDNLVELFEIVYSSKIVVSVDNGVKHIAGMFNKKLLTVYGPTSKTTCGASQQEISINSMVSCAPCGHINNCPIYLNKKCLTFLEARKLLSRLEEMVSE